METHYVVGVTVIPFARFGVLINIIFKEDIAYHVTISSTPHYTCPEFTIMSSRSLEKKKNGCTANIFYYVLRIMYKVDYDGDKFVLVSTFTYNKVMWLLEFAGVLESEYIS